MTAPTEPTPAPAAPAPVVVTPAALTFAEAAQAMAKTKTGRQVGRVLRLAAFAALTYGPTLVHSLTPDQQVLVTTVVVPALEAIYRGFKDPAA